ncbi:MAG: YkgJ family cysteine cluster protein [Candidatus Pacearchaeota archaeon]
MKKDKVLEVCQKCNAACCKMGGPDFTKSEMQKVLKAEHQNFFIKINSNYYELKSKKGVCPYLSKENSCLIHKEKPLMCKC